MNRQDLRKCGYYAHKQGRKYSYRPTAKLFLQAQKLDFRPGLKLLHYIYIYPVTVTIIIVGLSLFLLL